jgi:hypothetical protein
MHVTWRSKLGDIVLALININNTCNLDIKTRIYSLPSTGLITHVAGRSKLRIIIFPLASFNNTCNLHNFCDHCRHHFFHQITWKGKTTHGHWCKTNFINRYFHKCKRACTFYKCIRPSLQENDVVLH